MPQMRQPWLKIGHFASRILRKNLKYLELRCSLGEFQVAQIELLPSPSGLAIARERGKCNKGMMHGRMRLILR